jgi:hypothetical protein
MKKEKMFQTTNQSCTSPFFIMNIPWIMNLSFWWFMGFYEPFNIMTHPMSSRFGWSHKSLNFNLSQSTLQAVCPVVPSPPCVDFSHCSSAAASASRGTAVRDPGDDRISYTWALEDRRPGRPWMDPIGDHQNDLVLRMASMGFCRNISNHIQPSFLQVVVPPVEVAFSWCT